MPSPADKQHSPQFTCTGLASWTSSKDGLDLKCYGVTKRLKNAYVDLLEHSAGREGPAGPGVTLHQLSCWGSAVYQHEEADGAIPPPACLGIEFQRYRQAAAVLQQQSGAMQHQHHQHMPAAVARDIELLHAEQQQHMHHAAEQASTGSSSSSTSSSPAGTVEGPPEYHGRPGLFQRLQELHAEASERLENQGGPLWFGRAFATRAQANWESMQSMAGQILESMKADLGLPTKEEDPK